MRQLLLIAVIFSDLKNILRARVSVHLIVCSEQTLTNGVKRPVYVDKVHRSFNFLKSIL